MHSYKYHVYKNFISEDESEIFNIWILNNYDTNTFRKTHHLGTVRKTTRGNKNILYPNIAFDIQKRIDNVIKNLFNIDELVRVPDFYHGMYGSYGTEGDAVRIHKDPRWFNNFITYHFNIMLSNYENGELYIDNNLVPLNKTDAVLYPVSELTHYTSKLTGTKPRMFWCFGYCIPIQNTPFKV